jgi:hypothetical protein
MKKFFKGIFCEADGSPSFSRVSAGIIVAFALGWGTAVLVIQKRIDGDSVKSVLEAAAMMYTGNKISTALGASKKQAE